MAGTAPSCAVPVGKQRRRVAIGGGGQPSPMLHQKMEAKVDKLEAMTVERGASPAEAATAASLARRLIIRIGHRDGPDRPVHPRRRSALAPGVHVDIVSRRVPQAARLSARTTA